MKRPRRDARGEGGSRGKLILILTLASAAQAAADPGAIVESPPTIGIAFDEIARFVPAGAPPPSVGSFREDAAVIATLPPLILPKRHDPDWTALKVLAMSAGVSFAFGPAGAIPGVVFNYAAKAAGHVAIKENSAEFDKQKEAYANGKVDRQRTGVLAKFAYYRGWSRVELTPGAARIDKPDQGTLLTLDAASQTFAALHTAPIGEVFTATSTGARGAAILDGAPTVETLSAQQIDGIAARGYRTSGAIIITRDSFLCAAGRHHVTETEFVADLPDPRYEAAQDTSSAQPLVTACLLGNTVSHREPGRLVLYRIVMVDDDTPTSFGVALERGNVQQLTERDQALFQPPQGYSEKH